MSLMKSVTVVAITMIGLGPGVADASGKRKECKTARTVVTSHVDCLPAAAGLLYPNARP